MELLVKLQNPDRGEIIFCKPDGSPWGDLECMEKFLVVRVADITKAEVLAIDSEGIKKNKFDIDDAFSVEEIDDLKKEKSKGVKDDRAGIS